VPPNSPPVAPAPPTKPPTHLTNPTTDKTLQKRPLLHPQVPAAKSSAPKVVYISSKTPHIAIIKKVDAYLGIIDTPVRDKKGQPTKVGKKKPGEDGVTLKATGFAICSALALGNFFKERGDRVEVRTVSVQVVDDVVELPEGMEKRKELAARKKNAVMEEGAEGADEEMDVGKMQDIDMDEKEESDEDVEMVVRTTSGVEIFICRKENT
jgi:hypothetical protein